MVFEFRLMLVLRFRRVWLFCRIMVVMILRWLVLSVLGLVRRIGDLLMDCIFAWLIIGYELSLLRRILVRMCRFTL